MSENEDPESTIPWPGFVDILSTVIIVFVFFMMMTSVIIFVLSEQAKKAAVAEAHKQSQSTIDQQSTKSSPQPTLAPDVNNLLMQKEALQKEVAKLAQLKNVLSEATQQSTEAGQGGLTVHFGDLGATILKETDDAIQAMLPHNGRVSITSYVPKGSDFASIREIALNRALNIRNVLIQGNVANNKIKLKIVTLEEEDNVTTDDVYGRVQITFE